MYEEISELKEYLKTVLDNDNYVEMSRINNGLKLNDKNEKTITMIYSYLIEMKEYSYLDKVKNELEEDIINIKNKYIIYKLRNDNYYTLIDIENKEIYYDQDIQGTMISLVLGNNSNVSLYTLLSKLFIK